MKYIFFKKGEKVMKRRALAWLLILCMIFCNMPMTVFASSVDTGAGNGENITSQINEETTNVSELDEVEYATLQAAMSEANKAPGDYTITLIGDSAEVFTFAQKSGVNITIDGDGHTFSGKITLNAGGGNLIFTDAKIAPANSQAIYLNASTAPNITFDGCTLQGANKSGTIVLGQASATSNSVNVKNCTADNLQYIVSSRQTGPNSVLVENVTATNMIYLIRTLKCPSVTVKNVTCDAVIGIDIKNDGAGGKLVLENVNINVYTYGGTIYYPVLGSGAGASWTVEIKGINQFSANGIPYEGTEWFYGNEGYKNEPSVQVNTADGKVYICGSVTDVDSVAKSGDVVKLLANYEGDEVELPEGVKFDANGKSGADKITVNIPNYTAQIGDNKYTSVSAALDAAYEAGMKDVVIYLIGETTASTTDSIDLYSKYGNGTAFNTVTFKQKDATKATKAYYLRTLYTGWTTGKVVFDGVNVVVTGQLYAIGNVELINNSIITRSSDVKNFVFYGNMVIEPGSKFVSQVDEVSGGSSLTIDGGRTDGAINSAADYKTVWLYVQEGNTMTLKRGAYVIASNYEYAELHANGTVDVQDSRLDVFTAIRIGANGILKVDAGSVIKTREITGTGKIIIDTNGVSEGVYAPLDGVNLAGFTGTYEVEGTGYKAEIIDGKLCLVKNSVVKIGEQGYESLKAAIAAAQAGDTITFLADITENVTIDKALTIDGANFKYTGTMTMGAVTATIQNVNFVNGEIVKTSKPISGTFNIYDCTFKGETPSGYAIKIGYASAINIDGCQSNGNSFLYVPYSLTKLSVKNVTVDHANWAFHLVSIDAPVFENVTITNSNCGIVVQNTGNKVVTLKDCNIQIAKPLVIWEKQTNDVTFNFVGNNDFGTSAAVWAIANNNYVNDSGSQYAKLAFAESEATLTAAEGLDISPVTDYKVVYKEGKYSLELVIKRGTWGGIDWTLDLITGTLTIEPTKGTPVPDKNSGKTYEVGEWREAVRYDKNGNGKAVEGWPYDRSKVKTLVIKEGVTSIGSFTAQGFTNLTGEVVIPSTVTYIGQEAFQKSTFTKLTFAEGGTEELCIAQGAFKNLIIEEVALPADRPVHLHAWVFNNCHNLKKVTLPATLVSVHGTNHIDYFKDFNEHSNPTWTKASEIFAYDENLETITFGSEEVRDMFYANNNGTSKDYTVANVGLVTYCDLQAAFDAAKSGDEVVILKAGKYELTTSGKDITITGKVKGVVFDNIGAKNMGGANVTFNNVTFDYAGNSTYKGLQHAGNLVYNNCTFNGQVFLYGKSETFNNCTFNQTTENYNVWTYGAEEVAFNNCTFNSVGKSVLIYAESASIFNDVAVANCKFNASAAVEDKAAIEMDSSLTAGIKLTIEDTTAKGFGTGNVSGNSLWNNKKGNNTDANNDITVVVDGETVLAPVEFVAQVGELKYATLQAAIDAVKSGDNVITLLKDCDEDVTIDQTEGVNVVIDGNETTYTGTFTIHGNSRSGGEETLTFKNINFVTSEADHYFIDSNSKGSAERYAHNVTVEGCTFTATSEAVDSAVAMRIRQGFNIAIDDCEATNMHSLMQAYGNTGLTITDTTVNGKNGISAGTSTGVEISGVTINATGYGVRADGDNTGDMTVTKANINADMPIVVRKATGDYKLAVTNSILEGTNENTYAVIFTKGDDGTYVEPTGNYEVTVGEGVKVYPISDYVAEVEGKNYFSIQEAFDNADGKTVKLLADVVLSKSVEVSNTTTLDLNGKTITGTDNNTAGNFYLINVNKGNLTIKDSGVGGKITLVATTERNWSASSVVVANNQGTLTVEGGTINHLGGTSMAYGIDNLTNGTIGDATTTIKGGKVDSTYFAIRQFANSTTNMNKVVIVGGEVGYAWMQSPNSYVNTAATTVTGGTVAGICVSGVNADYDLSAEVACVGEVYGTMPAGMALTTVGGKYTLAKATVSIDRVGYASLAEAIAAVQNGQTITLLENNSENVTIVQAENKKFTIDGNDKTMTGTITIDGKSAAYATAGITIKNVNFDATSITKDASINLGNGQNSTRYTSNVTVENCTFVGAGKVAIKSYTGGDKNLTVLGCTAKNMHSLLQVKNVAGLNIDGCQVINSKNGISVGNSTGVTISNTEISATGYGVRADGENTGNMTVTNCSINAELPIVVRKATGDYKLDVIGGTLTGTNEKTYAVIFTKGDDGTYVEPTGNYEVTVDESVKVYPTSDYVARVGEKSYFTFAEALKAVNETDNKITLLADIEEEMVMVPAGVTLDLNGKILIAQYVASFGDIIDEAGNGMISVENARNVYVVKNNGAGKTTDDSKYQGYLPIFDTENSAYKFFEYELVHAGGQKGKNDNNDAVRFGFRLFFNPRVQEEAYALLKTSAEYVDLEAAITWGAQQTVIKHTFSQSSIKSYATETLKQIKEGKQLTKAMIVTVNGLSSLGADTLIYAAPTLSTDTGVSLTINGEFYAYQYIHQSENSGDSSAE